ncbi:MAG: ABC-F family ATP-binding cassette domain-containing protein [Oricola sp.]|nr:ABC-F family ATP-binding cassette domain-containing protein [Oricola sp.]
MSALLLTLSGVRLSIGGTPLFEDASLNVASGARIALVGRNGSGKSTLMKIAAGFVEPDAGERFMHPGATVRYLAQEPDASAFETIGDYASAGLDETGKAHEVETLLRELGLDPASSPLKLSGGELRRAAIAQALAAEPDILLLDEPTNHLDLPSIERLESALHDYPGAILIVTHDNDLADSVTNTKWTIDRSGGLTITTS